MRRSMPKWRVGRRYIVTLHNVKHERETHREREGESQLAVLPLSPLDLQSSSLARSALLHANASISLPPRLRRRQTDGRGGIGTAAAPPVAPSLPRLSETRTFRAVIVDNEEPNPWEKERTEIWMGRMGSI